MKARIAELEAELDKANADLKETTEKLNHTQAQLEEQTAKYNEAVKQRDQLQTELDAAVAKAKKDAELIEDLNNTVTEFKDTVYDLQEEGDEEINKANGEITKAEGIIETANTELKDANDAQDAANAEVSEANADVEKFGNEVNGIMKNLADILNVYFPHDTIIVPQINCNPDKDLPYIRLLCQEHHPDLIIGVELGAMYAIMLHDYHRICINPCSWYVLRSFTNITALENLDKHLFDNLSEESRRKCWGFFIRSRRCCC